MDWFLPCPVYRNMWQVHLPAGVTAWPPVPTGRIRAVVPNTWPYMINSACLTLKAFQMVYSELLGNLEYLLLNISQLLPQGIHSLLQRPRELSASWTYVHFSRALTYFPGVFLGCLRLKLIVYTVHVDCG